MKTWYSITAKAANDETTAEISIYDEIGIWGVTAKAFISDLKKIDAKKVILNVNSPGGSVFDGFAIYNALKNLRDSGTEITARVMGIAASAASFIVMAANKIEMPENSMMMVHYASGLAWGNAEDMRGMADTLDKIDASLVGIYTARTGKSEEDVRAMLEAETYLSAQEAKDAGFADTVIENVKATASFEIDRLPPNVQALFKAASEQVVEPPVEKTVAEQIEALAKEGGFEAMGEFFALNFESVEAAQAALSDAREIKSLCAYAKKDDQADNFIRQKTPVAKVRESLCNASAATDESTHVDTAPRNSNTPLTQPQPTGLKTSDVWAARQKQITNRKGA